MNFFCIVFRLNIEEATVLHFKRIVFFEPIVNVHNPLGYVGMLAKYSFVIGKISFTSR